MSNQEKTLISLKIDKLLKTEAQKLADELGLALSAVIIIYLKESVRARGLNLSALPHLNSSIELAIIEKTKDYENGINVSSPLSQPSEIASYLRKLCG